MCPGPGGAPSQALIQECQVWEIRDLSKDLIHGTQKPTDARVIGQTMAIARRVTLSKLLSVTRR